jgi:outer membrane biosynthesis protein TonB
MNYLLILLSFLIQVNSPGQDQNIRSVKASEVVMRQALLKRVVPEYPGKSIKNNASGVSVAKIMIGLDGNVEKVTILQSPDALISDSVRTALAGWSFEKTMVRGQPVKVETIITYYFVIEKGKGIVREPKLPVWKEAKKNAQSKK